MSPSARASETLFKTRIPTPSPITKPLARASNGALISADNAPIFENLTKRERYLIEKFNIVTVSGSAFGIEKPLIIRISFIDVKINYNSFLTNGNEYNYVNVKKCLEKLENWLSNL